VLQLILEITTVKVIAIGEKKGSDLFIRDEWYEL
jgi:hypothetical protein